MGPLGRQIGAQQNPGNVESTGFSFCRRPRATAIVVANHDEDTRKALELVAACGAQASIPSAV